MNKIKEVCNLNRYDESKVEKILVLFSFLFVLILTILLSYHSDFTRNNNLLFESDTARVIEDATEMAVYHYRLNVHPLYVIMIQPLVNLLKGITIDKILALIIVQSLITTASIWLLYKTLSFFSKDKNKKVLLCLLYLFSFSNIIYTAGIELYNLAALGLIALWYYAIKIYQAKKASKIDCLVLILLGVVSLGVTITNFVVFGIVIFILWISKKVKLHQAIIIGLSSIVLMVGVNVAQGLIWHTTPLIYKQDLREERGWNDPISYREKVKRMIKDDYYHTYVANNIEVKVTYGNEYLIQNFVFKFKDKENPISFLIVTCFYILLLYMMIKNFKKNLMLNIGLLLTLLFNSFFHTIYGNASCFLYSLHFAYLGILLLGINLDEKKEKKWIPFLLRLIVLIELLMNSYGFMTILRYTIEIVPKSYFVATFGLPLTIVLETILFVVITFAIIFLVKLGKKVLKEKDKDKKILKGLGIAGLIFLIQCTFIGIEAVKQQNALLWLHFGPGDTINRRVYKTEYLEKDFKEYFQKETESLETYLDEYHTLKNEMGLEDNNGIDIIDMYLFGFGNRRKLAFVKNKLVDVNTKEVLYQFSVKERLIVPNEYAVVLETNDHHYIKFYEDNLGVHYVKDGKEEMVEGTEIPLNLPTFKKGKYQNIKKNLVAEILWNIEEGKIYSNRQIHLSLTTNQESVRNFLEKYSLKELLKEEEWDALQEENQEEQITSMNHISYPISYRWDAQSKEYDNLKIIDGMYEDWKYIPTDASMAAKILEKLEEN